MVASVLVASSSRPWYRMGIATISLRSPTSNRARESRVYRGMALSGGGRGHRLVPLQCGATRPCRLYRSVNPMMSERITGGGEATGIWR